MIKLGSLNNILANWALLLSPYDIHFIPQKATKGQAIADFFAEHSVMENSKLHNVVPDEVAKVNAISKGWTCQLFFDGVARRDAVRVGLY